MFPVFQQYFRSRQPPALIMEGSDIYISVKEAYCYKRDLPDAQVHIVDGGHKILEINFDEVVLLIDSFLD